MTLAEKEITSIHNLEGKWESNQFLSNLRDQIFLYLMKNAGRKYTISEIARIFNIESSINLCCPYSNLRRLLDQMVQYALIESELENGDTHYFINRGN